MVELVMTIPRSDRVSTENGWKIVPLENVNCVKLNRFRLKRLIPIEQDLLFLQPRRTADFVDFQRRQFEFPLTTNQNKSRIIRL